MSCFLVATDFPRATCVELVMSRHQMAASYNNQSVLRYVVSGVIGAHWSLIMCPLYIQHSVSHIGDLNASTAALCIRNLHLDWQIWTDEPWDWMRCWIGNEEPRDEIVTVRWSVNTSAPSVLNMWCVMDLLAGRIQRDLKTKIFFFLDRDSWFMMLNNEALFHFNMGIKNKQ